MHNDNVYARILFFLPMVSLLRLCFIQENFIWLYVSMLQMLTAMHFGIVTF